MSAQHEARWPLALATALMSLAAMFGSTSGGQALAAGGPQTDAAGHTLSYFKSPDASALPSLGKAFSSSGNSAEIPMPKASFATYMTLLARSCWDNGEDEVGLADLAARSGWNAVGAAELKRRSDAAASMVGGWTFEGELGTTAVIQSRENVTPPVYVCSTTTRFLPSQSFDDVRHSFESAFKAEADGVIQSADQIKYSYWLAHIAGCEARLSLIHSKSTDALTIRILHGRTRPAESEMKSPDLSEGDR